MLRSIAFWAIIVVSLPVVLVYSILYLLIVGTFALLRTPYDTQRTPAQPQVQHHVESSAPTTNTKGHAHDALAHGQSD